jgi:7-carboxy-7-deazaguanine synthase
MNLLNVAEIFTSIQGESTYAGIGCFFIRLAGCNLHCSYCDTAWSRDSESGSPTSIDAITRQARESGMPLIEITGGEPLMQEGFYELAQNLADIPSRTVLVETNGSLDISCIPENVIAIIDIKCPDSGAANSFDQDNIKHLRKHDEIKFVLSSIQDYEWARDLVSQHNLTDRVNAVHFAPVHGAVDPTELSHWILNDRLPVRLQIQLHKIINIQ